MRSHLRLTALLAILFAGQAIAADCSQKRPSGGTSGKELGTLARSNLDFACDILTNTTGPGWGQAFVEGYTYMGTNPQALSTVSKFCKTAFNQIISQCVENGDYYGGQYFFDGQAFNLTNAMAPKTPKGGNAVSHYTNPPPVPQQNGTPDYADIRCGDGGVGDPFVFGRTRWGESGAEYALNDFNNAWKSGLKDQGKPWVQQLGHFWNGPEGWSCDVLQDQCGAGVQPCGDRDTTGKNGHTIQNPAAWLIMNSFTNIHNFYLNQFNSFESAGNDMGFQMDSFSKTFSPVPADDSYIIKIILDALTMGYGQIAAFAWNVALKKVLVNYSNFKKADGSLDSDRHGWSKDGVNSLVTGMLGLGKDLLPKAQTQDDATKQLDKLLGWVVKQYSDTTTAFVKSLFAGDDNAVSAISDTIKDGKWIDNAFVNAAKLDNTEMRDIAEKVFYGQLIPAAWSQVGGLHPIVVYDDKICSGDNSKPFDGDRYIDKNTQNKVGMCYKGLGMWILSVNDGTIDGPRQIHQPPKARSYNYPPNLPNEPRDADPLVPRRLINPDDEDPHIFDLLPGGSRDELDGTKWGGIQVEDLIISSYEAYLLNGNKNGYKLNLDDTDALKKTDSSNSGDTLFSAGVRTPGVFSFPVCKIATAVQNWKSGWMKDKPEFYPCN